MQHQAAVITCSDRASEGVYEDESGPVIREVLVETGFEVGRILLVPDDGATIQEAIIQLVTAGVRVVFTTGGTGVGPRDVTVDATKDLLDYELPGIAEEIRRVSIAATPMGMVSRGTAGVISRDEHRALIVNAPGSPGGARDAATTVAPVLQHLIGQLDGKKH